MEGKIIHKAGKSGEKLGRRSKMDLKGSRVKTMLAGNQIYVRRWPATVLARQYNAMPGFFLLLVLARTGFEPKSEMLGDAAGVSLWTKGLINYYCCTRQQDTKHTRQAIKC